MPAIVSSGFQLLDIDPAIITDTLSDAIVLKNGNILLVGDQFSSTGNIQIRFFSPTGTPLGAVQNVNSTTFDLQADAKVTELANGNIVIVWTDESATAPDFSGQTVRMQVYNSNGVAIGGEIAVPTTTLNDQSVETVVALADGRFAVYWQDDNSFPATKFRLFNSDGTPASAEITGPTNFFTSSDEGFSASHGSGGLIMAGISGVSFSDRIVVQRYNSDGTANGGVIEVVGAGNYDDAKISQLSNGNYILTWTDTSNTPPFNKGPIVYAQVINANGETVGSSFTVSDDIFSEHSQSEITALANGQFAVSWLMRPDNDTNGYKHVMRVFNADGSPASDVTIVYDNSVNYGNIRNFAHLQSVSILPDGRLLYSFNALEPASTAITATRIVDPRSALDVTLTDQQENFTGTIFNDKIRGQGGNDFLYGEAGDDSLYGGNGNDTISGQSGSDSLWGGIGADAHFGGNDGGIDYARYDDANYGNLVIRLDNSALNTGAAAGDTYNGIEGLVGGAGQDTVVGNASNNYLFGGGNADNIYGVGGNDYLSGDAGSDNLWGGAGADQHIGGNDGSIDYARYDDANYGNLTIRLDNAALNVGAAAVGDTYNGIEGLIGGLGNDTIIGNASANYLYGSGGNDFIDGQGGNDYLNGGIGADRFRFSSALGVGNIDTIAGFAHAVDDILLLKSIFSAIGVTLTADEFRIGSAQDANDHILYNNITGALYYDSNGNASGGITQFATVAAGTLLDVGDFMMA